MFAFSAASVSAGGFSTVSPAELDLDLGAGEMVIEQVSLTIDPFCVRPFDVDVVASDPDALALNLTGVLVNECGGDTTTFDIEFTGTAAPQIFDLLFVDAEFGGVLATIPVTIDATPAAEPLLGLLIRERGILFQVSSNGCTTKGDFQVDVLESFPLQLRLIRLQEDLCDAVLPLGTRILFSYRELKIQRGDQLQVVNPLGIVEVPAATP